MILLLHRKLVNNLALIDSDKVLADCGFANVGALQSFISDMIGYKTKIFEILTSYSGSRIFSGFDNSAFAGASANALKESQEKIKRKFMELEQEAANFTICINIYKDFLNAYNEIKDNYKRLNNEKSKTKRVENVLWISQIATPHIPQYKVVFLNPQEIARLYALIASEESTFKMKAWLLNSGQLFLKTMGK